MSFRSVHPTTLRACSPPSYLDNAGKPPLPSASAKAPPQKKPDVRVRSLLDEPSPKSAPVILSSTESSLDNSANGIIDMDTFGQILELDEDGTNEFSWGMVLDYFSQAESTFSNMDAAFTARDLVKLSNLGHFLKGSSAALGITQVQAICEKIQNLGNPGKEVETKEAKLSPEEALAKIEPLLARVKVEHAKAVKSLRAFYER
ncbi:histidine-phosphotransfer domain HPT domain-containing protein [Pisolithus marmoratus]|nr:histidine-phosphotransfer domain HPT domain-containing protein [Pisolithus marmoratus]